MAVRAYNSPGVTVTETVNPSLAPLLANPSIVAIVGSARGYQSGSDRVVLTQQMTTVTSSFVAGTDTTMNVTSTAGFDTTGTLEVGGQDGTPAIANVTYTGKTATTFTGCAGGTGTFGAAEQVRQQNRVLLAHSGILTATAVVKSAVTGSTLDDAGYLLAAGTDPDTGVTGDEPYYINRRTTPDTGPTLANGTATGLTGTYDYRVAFVNAAGETVPGPASNSIAVTDTKISLSAIPVGPSGTTSRIIYRRKTVGTLADNLYHVVATIADNTAVVLANENMADATANAAAQPKEGIASGDTVVVSYDYIDNNYYEPTLTDTLGDAFDKYGAEFDANGNVDSELMYAARLAFLNGASEVMLVASSADSDNAVETALAQLESEPDVRIVVAARGTATVNAAVKAHVDKMNAQGLYRVGVVGRDGSTTMVSADTLRAGAKAFNSESLVHVSPSSFIVENNVTGQNMNVGGQYAAAAVAGMLVARDVQVPLTRKNLAGFSGYNDKRTNSDLAIDAANGLLVIENKGGVMTVRHGVTTNVGSVNSRELSVVRAKYDMAHRIRESLDSSVVGVVVPMARAPGIVQAAVVGILEQLTIEGSIDAYGAIKARLLQGDPTTVEVRFEYTPAYPINNVNVVFTINTNTGEFALAA